MTSTFELWQTHLNYDKHTWTMTSTFELWQTHLLNYDKHIWTMTTRLTVLSHCPGERPKLSDPDVWNSDTELVVTHSSRSAITIGLLHHCFLYSQAANVLILLINSLIHFYQRVNQYWKINNKQFILQFFKFIIMSLHK